MRILFVFWENSVLEAPFENTADTAQMKSAKLRKFRVGVRYYDYYCYGHLHYFPQVEMVDKSHVLMTVA